MSDYERAIVSSQRALALATTLGDLALQIGAHVHLGIAYYAMGDYRQGIEFLSRNMASLTADLLYERFGRHFPPSVTSGTFLSLCLVSLGAFDEGIARAEAGLRIAEVDERPSSIVFACYGLGLTCLYRGELQRAITTLERGWELCQTANVRTFFLPTVASLGYTYALSGRVAEAQALLKQVAAHSLTQNIFGVLWAVLSGAAHLLTGRPEDAMTLATYALERSRTYKEHGHQAEALRLLGDIAMHRDPPEIEQAESYYQQALALADELGMRPLQAHCHRGLGTLYSQTGQSEQARAELSTAIEMYRDMEMTFWQPETEATFVALESQ
jgi:tetratricopeptide (TPR) repeat protein